MPAIMPPTGFYVRYDSILYEGSNPREEDDAEIFTHGNIKTFRNDLRMSYFTDRHFLGARYGVSSLLPTDDTHLHSAAQVLNTSFAENTYRISGLGDIAMSPLVLSWKTARNIHVAINEWITFPTANYSPMNVFNLGNNYWKLNTGLAFTWLSPHSQEISFISGVTYNTDNMSINYHKGTEFYLDALLAQHFNKSFAAGVSGYYYQQITADTGENTTPGLKSFSDGIGPSILWIICLKDNYSINIIGRAVFELSAKDRYLGDAYMLTLSAKV